MNPRHQSSFSKNLIRLAALLAVVALLSITAAPAATAGPLQDVRDLGNGQVELTVACNGQTYLGTFDSRDVMGATHWINHICYDIDMPGEH